MGRTLKHWVSVAVREVITLPLVYKMFAGATTTALVVALNPEEGAFQFITSCIAGSGLFSWAMAHRAGWSTPKRVLTAGGGAISAFALVFGAVYLPETVAEVVLVVLLFVSSAGFPVLFREFQHSREAKERWSNPQAKKGLSNPQAETGLSTPQAEDGPPKPRP